MRTTVKKFIIWRIYLPFGQFYLLIDRNALPIGQEKEFKMVNFACGNMKNKNMCAKNN